MKGSGKRSEKAKEESRGLLKKWLKLLSRNIIGKKKRKIEIVVTKKITSRE